MEGLARVAKDGGSCCTIHQGALPAGVSAVPRLTQAAVQAAARGDSWCRATPGAPGDEPVGCLWWLQQLQKLVKELLLGVGW